MSNLSTKSQTNIQKIDFFRAFFSSFASPIIESVAMLVLIRYFNSNILEKTILASFMKSGLLFGIIFVWLFKHYKLTSNIILTLMLMISSFFILSASFTNNQWLFILLLIGAGTAFTGVEPVLVDLYGRFDKKKRGRRFLTTVIAVTIGTQISAWIAGYMIEDNISNWIYHFRLTAIALMIASLISYRFPKIKFSASGKDNIQKYIKLLKKDRLFTYILASWFIFGMANLWLYPYRINFLAEAQFGFHYSESQIMLLVAILQPAVMFISLPIFAYLFDKINVISMRILINIIFSIYVLTFFLGGSMFYHVLGLVLQGIAFGGGTFVWKLWVTRIAPTKEISSYMAIHTGLTGFRMVVAPLIGLFGLIQLGPTTCAWISFTMIIISSMMLIPIAKNKKYRFNY